MNVNKRLEYDLVVIGAGSAGNKVARKAGKRGLRVALVERDKLGGTCLNYGCDPTKTMVRCAEVARLVTRAPEFGIHTGPMEVDFPSLVARVHAMIDTIRGNEPDGGLSNDGVDLIRESARFVGPRTLQVGDTILEGDRVVIATGMSPVVPDVEGLEGSDYVTHQTVFNITGLPKRLLILGGGSVGVEFAQIFARLGSHVTIVEMMPDLMLTEEPEISSAIRNLLEREGVNVFTESTLERIDHENGEPTALISMNGDKEAVGFDLLLIAVGRKPNTGDLNLDAAEVDANEKGIVVDDELRTSADSVWACGDVTGRYPFTHVASHHADVVLANLLDDAHRKIDEKSIPWVIFTDPELAHVGMTEGQAREAGHRVRVSRIEAESLPRARTARETFGLGKMVADTETGLVLGASLLCWYAGEMIHEVGLAIREGIRAESLAGTIHSYLTMSQIVPGLAWRAGKNG